MRPLSACIACRDRRKKCDRPRHGTSCTFCTSRGIQCAVEQKPVVDQTTNGYDPLFSPRGDGKKIISTASIMPDRELLDELVDLYFRYIHVAFHNILHRPSFEASVKDGSAPRVLVFGVISLAARFSTHSYFSDTAPQERGRPYAKEAERLLDLHNASITTVQACLLLSVIQVVEMDTTTEAVYLAIACRLAMILKLPDAPATNRIDQELNLRVWWSVVTTDTWAATALGLPRAVTPRYDIHLPMDERVFLSLPSDSPPRPVDATHQATTEDTCHSLIAQMIQLNRILYDINTLHLSIVNGSVDQIESDETTARLASALDAWLAVLPDEMSFTHDNLLYWATAGCGQAFVVLHINYNHLGQLLFYRFLHRTLRSDETTSADTAALNEIYATRCKEHAATVCNVVYRSMETPGADVMYPLACHVLVIASTVHLYTLLFSANEDAIQIAKSRLENNFRIISILQTYWPSLEASFSRLAAFHKACLEEKDGSFQLDRWMLRFLLEFASPVDERDVGVDDKRALGDIVQLKAN